MRVGLISCSVVKLDRPAPAYELYQGPLYKLYKSWIIRSVVIGARSRHDTNEWAILSAKYGLVMPDQELEPYDLKLTELSDEDYKAWCGMVYEQLMDRWGDRVIYTVLAGAYYRTPVQRMPMCEDPIRHWTELRVYGGMTRRRAAMSIGVLKRELKERLVRLQWIKPELIRECGQERYNP